MKKLSFAAVTAATLVALYGCGDSNSTSADPTPQSSAAVESSSAVIPEEPAVPSSSSVTDTPTNPEVSSSSATKNPSVGEVACGDLWCGKTDKVGRLITGYEDETSGWWYLYNDNYAPDNGNSKIVFPGKLNDWGWNDGDFFGYLAEEFGGIKASVVIGNDYKYPYAGFGFNIVNEDQVGGDITDWGGLCLVYSSTAPFEIFIEEENWLEKGGITYSASVPVSETLTVVNLPWKKFSLPWGYPGGPEDILKKAAAVKLRFEQSGDFFLKSIGREGTCPAVVVPESSSSSISSSSSSSSSVKPSSSAESTGELKASFLWKGDDTEGRVITGSPDESSGYWYSYDDSYPPNNGNSKIVFPSDVVEDEEGNFFGPLNVKYGGVKAEVKIGTAASENAFAGFGFNIWSENQEGVDISKWEGICLTYSSTGPFYIELGPEDEASYEYINYKATVPASETVTTVNVPWKMYRIPWGCPGDCSVEDVLDKIAQIKLRFENSSDFLLKEIGSLDACGK